MHFIDFITERVGNVLAWLLFAMAGIMIAEIVLRYGFNSPLLWSFELTAFIFGGLSVLSGGYTLLHKGHIMIDILYSRFSSKTKAIIDLCATFIFFFFCAPLLWYSAEFAWSSILSQEKYSSVWAPVLWPFKSAIFIGVFLLVLQGISQFIHALHIVTRGEGQDK